MVDVANELSQRLHALAPEQLAKVEELVRFLEERDDVRAALLLSEPSFARFWDDPENDVYNDL